MNGQAGTPLPLLPLGMSSAVYTSGQTPMIRNSCCTMMFSCTPSSTPSPTSFSRK